MFNELRWNIYRLWELKYGNKKFTTSAGEDFREYFTRENNQTDKIILTIVEESRKYSEHLIYFSDDEKEMIYLAENLSNKLAEKQKRKIELLLQMREIEKQLSRLDFDFLGNVEDDVVCQDVE